MTRVRFAPSPTGYFHVGSARTALFNWVVARQAGDAGTFILRIEDTDTERNREEWVGGIISAMEWLGLEPDEGPYRQSEHRDRYDAAVDLLWDAGRLYACGCTRGEVEARNAAAGIATPGYDGHCRDRGLERRAPDGSGRALRFATEATGSTLVDDVIRGEVVFPHEAMEDFVVVKSDGDPLFVIANVVDDIDMAITHVIRGEDLLPTTPKGVLLWRALAEAGHTTRSGEPVPDLPVFAHLPLLVNEKRQKLSKRRDPVAVEGYRDQGYLPEAFVNYLCLLGWSPKDGVERFSLEQFVEWFDLAEVNHAPAFFDVVKMTHMNGEVIRALPLEEFVERCRPFVGAVDVPWNSGDFDEAVFREVAPLVQERVAVLSEVVPMVDFFFVEEVEIDGAELDRLGADPVGIAILADAVAAYGELASADRFGRDALHESTLEVGERHGRKLGKAQAPIRLAVTGRKVGPPLFESLEILGWERVRARMETLAARLGSGAD